jgi:hypothetical protein
MALDRHEFTKLKDTTRISLIYTNRFQKHFQLDPVVDPNLA